MFVVIFKKKKNNLSACGKHPRSGFDMASVLHAPFMIRGDSLHLSHLFHDVETVVQIHFPISQLINELNRNRARGALWKRKACDNGEDSKGDFQ